MIVLFGMVLGRFWMVLVIGAMCEVRLHWMTRGHDLVCIVVVLGDFGDFCDV